MRARDPAAVVQALKLRTVLPANWRSGLTEAAERGVFVTPAVGGWVFAVGPDLRGASPDVGGFVAPLLERLSAAFEEAAWFATDSAAEQHGWALARHGELVRGYAFDGGNGHVFWHGEVTDAERALQCFVDDPRDQSDDDVKWWPDERIVLALAGAWSLDPARLGEARSPAGVGWFGRC